MSNKKLYGIKAIYVMSIFIVIGSLIMLFAKHSLKIDTPLIPGGYINILFFITISFFILVIIGLEKRNYILYKVLVIGFILFLISSIYISIKNMMLKSELYQTITSFLSLLIIALIVWYLLIRKGYFIDSKEEFKLNESSKKQELFFIIVFVLLWLIFFFITPSLK